MITLMRKAGEIWTKVFEDAKVVQNISRTKLFNQENRKEKIHDHPTPPNTCTLIPEGN